MHCETPMSRFLWLCGACFVLLACGDDTSGSGGDGESGDGGSPGSGAGSPGGGSDPVGGSLAVGGGQAGGGGPTALACDPLAAPSGAVIDVGPSDSANLASIVGDAAAGTTLRFAAGTYAVPGILQLRQAGVTIRSADDDAGSVIFDGGYTVPEIFQVNANDVTIAHVTVTHAVDHLVHVSTAGQGEDVTGFRLYGVRMIDSGEQFLKVNPGGDGGYVDAGRVECSTFEMTAEGRQHVESCCGGCYTGGIDTHSGRGWVVAGNRFEGIHCENGGLAEHAIHFWRGARDTVVEDNTIIDCARGVGFGLAGGQNRTYSDDPYPGLDIAHYDGVIRNNVIYASNDFFDTGVELQSARTPLVIHNTVVTPGGAAFFSSIDCRFPETNALVVNNLTTRITTRDSATADFQSNLEETPLSYFADEAGHDFHLTDAATDALGQGVPNPDAGLDIDGQAHDATTPDRGADEHP